MTSKANDRLKAHLALLGKCHRCSRMESVPVMGSPCVSRVMLIGQAPGDKEPKMGKPFAWTAGKTLFRWFQEHCGVEESLFRSSIYMAAVCRCFPGKLSTGGDRVPDPSEIENCQHWMREEMKLLKPQLLIPVGKLAISLFLPPQKLDQIIGRKFEIHRDELLMDVIPLPHPSGASPWHRMEPGRSLLQESLRLIKRHSAFRACFGS